MTSYSFFFVLFIVRVPSVIIVPPFNIGFEYFYFGTVHNDRVAPHRVEGAKSLLGLLYTVSDVFLLSYVCSYNIDQVTKGLLFSSFIPSTWKFRVQVVLLFCRR